MQERGMQNKQGITIDGPGQALFRFVRYWSRRWTGAGQAVDPERGRDVMVTEAVQALETRGGATVNDVADELGIDQSGASRFIAQAVDRGYLRKIASSRDARQRLLVVTDEGATFLATAHQWQEQVFTELTAEWSPAEIKQFHQLMERLVHARNTMR
jgi:MarR family transcriptional regulator, organic hydroperoxide resistance regulator